MLTIVVVVKRDEIEDVRRKFKANAERTINFMTSYDYLVRILLAYTPSKPLRVWA